MTSILCFCSDAYTHAHAESGKLNPEGNLDALARESKQITLEFAQKAQILLLVFLGVFTVTNLVENG